MLHLNFRCYVPSGRRTDTLMCTPVSVRGNSQQKKNDLKGYVRKVASWFPDQVVGRVKLTLMRLLRPLSAELVFSRPSEDVK